MEKKVWMLKRMNQIGMNVWSKKQGTGMKNSEYDQEVPQSQTADKPMAPKLSFLKSTKTLTQKIVVMRTAIFF